MTEDWDRLADLIRENAATFERLEAEVAKLREDLEALTDKLSRVCEVHHLWDGS